MSTLDHDAALDARPLPGVAPRRLPARLLRLAGDDRLVELVRSGSAAAFEVLYDRHHRGVLAFCRHMLGSAEEAEDAVQHTFLAAYRELVDSRKAIRLRPWLYAIARNRCLSVLRRRREQPLAEAAEPATEHLAAEVQRREDLRDLLRDLAGLPDDQRAALVLAEVGDVSHEEIAQVIGCGRDKVKALVFQARSSLAASRAAREASCPEIREQLASLRGGSLRRNTLRRHLRECAGCRAFQAEVRAQRRALALVLPVAPSVGLREAVLGSVVGGGGAAAAAGAGGGLAAKALVAVAVAGGGATAGVVTVDQLRESDPARPAAVVPAGEDSAQPASGGGREAEATATVETVASGEPRDRANPAGGAETGGDRREGGHGEARKGEKGGGHGRERAPGQSRNGEKGGGHGRERAPGHTRNGENGGGHGRERAPGQLRRGEGTRGHGRESAPGRTRRSERSEPAGRTPGSGSAAPERSSGPGPIQREPTRPQESGAEARGGDAAAKSPDEPKAPTAPQAGANAAEGTTPAPATVPDTGTAAPDQDKAAETPKS